ncbi:ubiquinol-cytochrome c reductase iron-sulfur subunit [Rickettsia endosymbiont of Cardiosporidium cionae]|uniref:ubiquinol-cytochrome c reductase iron-sulfur subunit n=1 Tax=Rickettsia endosymbiont of Cardiosporidium cionae TaxID=2777155 RepID=UPI001895AA2C|nr:ubiquinol-cytochrome c reductase iron-sulfur subunit [Rickettsia endosymbiont of Cardiosporidium cionae]KAF8818703.1 ubiquinol-cytochrome c reductase iron-sulfur subunit [Rickettsia endosymbiont of Cardiosporidium cionae]
MELDRRDFIVLTATGMVAIGALCTIWPLVDSMNPAADILAISEIEVDLSSILAGESLTVKWQGKPVFIKHRKKSEIHEAEISRLDKLIDPEYDSNRVKEGHSQWLIVIGICTHLGCIPVANKGDYMGGWFCPCHGSHYDSSGRIRKGPAPKNLIVPPYNFINDNKVRIG